MTRSKAVVDTSSSESEAGGFIKDDPDLRKAPKKSRANGTKKAAASKRTRSSKRESKANVSYIESSDEDVIPEDDATEPPLKRSKTKAKTRAKAPKIESEDEYKEDDDDDEDDADFVDALEGFERDPEDDDVVIIRASRSREGSSFVNPVSLTDESDLEDVLKAPDDEDDVPLAQRSDTQPAKKPRKKRAPAKPKKPKVPYFTRATAKLYEHHPDLKDVFPHLELTEQIKPERAPQPEGLAVRLLPFQQEGLNWLVKQENSVYGGGILADEMGMGKTIQTIALFMDDPTKKPNLVVAPTVALMQWKSEIETHTNNKLKVGVFHGANRAKSSEDLSEFDVVLTTYSVLESSFRRERYGFTRKNKKVKEKSALHGVHFYRVILDEAHNVKDRQSGTAKAANELNTEKRWCLSGTPLQNRIGEMYSLIRFMKLYPFCQYFCTKCPCRSNEWKFSDGRRCDYCDHAPMLHTNFFNHFMLKNIQKHGIEGEGATSFKHIRMLLKHIMLRRTKVERADDLGLPPRIVEIRRDVFNEQEKDLYSSLYGDSRRRFNDYVAEGVVLNNYANIFTLITRMRQLADHPDLVLRRLGSNSVEASTELLTSGTIVCQLCDDEAEEALESKCHHRFCRMCIREYTESFNGREDQLKCPVCHIALSIDLEGPAIEMSEQAASKGSIVNRIKMDGDWRSSTKIEALVEELYKLRSDRQTIKSIVFSQFTSMLDLVEWRLKRAGFETVKLQGSMSPIQRESTINHFMQTPSVEVFLVSLKAGGVALNLCEASQVFILDPWWNPSVEWQSGDRVHRIGQHRPVKITRFCIEDSIESRIIELQEKKANMINATINHDDAAVNKLTPGDLQFLFTS
ncbi:unnamed protein product [Kuraishia capsulata CBS 1993]|uniref:DNA repair protein RAD16 n=1 Tax=Kuraishia capsulata CBS 1993 TaxID=1382522 RepID=W6MF50_9ASCO|nr:uncharacterized protein KUCA_T00000234001 [Kuraishia capsulata CBS 1993]CDK24274.1 unnamed protein product [Kuraishia capsulata CBS 1993]